MNIPPLAPGYYAVFLEDFECQMRLGIYESETTPQTVRISIAAIVQRLGPGDGIEDVVDYNHLRDAASEAAQARHFGLQETLCETLIETMTRHPHVEGAIVETRKMEAYRDAQAVGCQMAQIAPAALAR